MRPREMRLSGAEFPGGVVLAMRFFDGGWLNITARLPLSVRPSAPRFANFGDSFELPVVVQNQTDAPLQVDVAVRKAVNGGIDTAAASASDDPAGHSS